MKRVALLGSTGSIGRSTLDVVAAHPDRFAVEALAAGSNMDLLLRQIRRFHPRTVALADPKAASELGRRLGRRGPEVLAGREGVVELARSTDSQIVVSAIAGSEGLAPTAAAVEAGRTVVLANKESIVMAGEWLMRRARLSGARIIPVDSEHNAIFQCMDGRPASSVRSLSITASGGPFLRTPLKMLDRVTPDQALHHPVWKMGRKITVDSATLMNKALELIEMRWLFGIPEDRLRVWVHPQSIVHAVVEFVDTAALALMALPDMKVPIAYALAYPDRLTMDLPRLDLAASGPLTFLKPDAHRFPSLALGYDVLRAGNGASIVMNAANEVAVEAFLNGRIGFRAITRAVASALDRYTGTRVRSLGDVFEVDRWARDEGRRRCSDRPLRKAA